MKRLIAGLVLGGTVLGAPVLAMPAFAATKGTVHVWSELTPSPTSPIIFTGAFGDYGTATNIDKNGKTDQNGNYVRIVLKKGTFEVNAVALGKEFSKLQPVFAAGCSATFTGSAQVTFFQGTGAYAGINGTITVTSTNALVLPTLKNGKCNETESGTPLSQYETITGSGSVTFG